MKKKMVILVLLLLAPFMIFTVEEKESAAMEFEVIPDDAIRLRILANSDEETDQEIKYFVRDQVSAQIDDWVGHMTNIEEAREYIRQNIPELIEVLEQALAGKGIDQELDISYKSDVTFPVKLYDSVLYPAGDYEAVLVTLGEGGGANWWCVLFPPLCFLDFSNGTTIAEDKEEAEEVKVKFFLLEWLGLS